MTAHIHHLAQENIAGVQGMQRIYLRVLCAVEIVDIVALDGLVKEREPQSYHKEHDDEKFPAQVSR